MTRLKMVFSRVGILGALALSASLISGCSKTDSVVHENNQDHHAGHEHIAGSGASHKTAKTSAAVKFSDDFDGSVEVGIREEILVSLDSAYQTGRLVVEINTTEGMDLLSDSRVVIELPASDISVPVELYAESDGRYSLNLFAQWLGDNGEFPSISSKSIAMQVGAADLDSVSKSTSGASLQKASAGKSKDVMVYSAQETVR